MVGKTTGTFARISTPAVALFIAMHFQRKKSRIRL